MNELEYKLQVEKTDNDMLRNQAEVDRKLLREAYENITDLRTRLWDLDNQLARSKENLNKSKDLVKMCMDEMGDHHTAYIINEELNVIKIEYLPVNFVGNIEKEV